MPRLKKKSHAVKQAEDKIRKRCKTQDDSESTRIRNFPENCGQPSTSELPQTNSSSKSLPDKPSPMDDSESTSIRNLTEDCGQPSTPELPQTNSFSKASTNKPSMMDDSESTSIGNLSENCVQPSTSELPQTNSSSNTLTDTPSTMIEMRRQYKTLHQQNTRETQEYRQKERLSDRNRRLNKRNDVVYRSQEGKRETESRKRKRQDDEYRKQEDKRETKSRKRRRQDHEYRKQEEKRETESKKRRRQDLQYRKQEEKRETESRKRRRQDVEYQNKEAKAEKKRKQDKRDDVVYKDHERKRETHSRKLKRQGIGYHHERKRETHSRKLRRQDIGYLKEEAKRETRNRKRRRQDVEFRNKEAKTDKERRQERRHDVHYKKNENQRETLKRQIKKLQTRPNSPVSWITHFHATVSEGPIYTCTSCNQLWYRHSVEVISEKILHSPDHKIQEVIQNCPLTQSIDNKVWMCRTCKSYISKGKVPPLSVMNGMKFPNPGILQKLNPLELTLLAVRLPFMKIHQAPRGKQKKICGNIVLVPADVDNTVCELPRLPSNTATIKATLKRKLKYKHHVYCLNIRPEMVRQGAQFLSQTPLYKEHVTFNTNFDFGDTDTEDEEGEEPAQTSQTENMQNIEHGRRPDVLEQPNVKGLNTQDTTKDNEDCWSEVDDADLISGQCDTMLTTQDFIEPNERDLLYNFAPAEKNIPVSVFLDKHSEELAFPAIFCGQRRPSNNERKVKVTYSSIVKSELRNTDRRAASNVENIFFKTKKIQMKSLIDQCQLALRKVKSGDKQLTAKDVRGTAVTDLIHEDKAYKFLASIRGSPPYFQKISKDLFSMIRQLGPATFFITLSAAETRWLHLLRILGQTVDNRLYTDEELIEMNWDEKCRLIQSDPITCAAHFNFSTSKFISIVILQCCPLGKVNDYFDRVEYQQRGSPHIHMMVWSEDAPQYGKDTDEEVCEYIDKFIKCTKPTEDNEFKSLVDLQTHRHSNTCRKKRERKCRFGFPKPPMRNTKILQPLTEPEFTKAERDRYKQLYKTIEDFLYKAENEEDMTFDEFLGNFGLEEDKYILAVRASINTATVMLKRTLKETRTNNYNETILKSWRANVDVQFILDVYACATYVASYITKSHRGMSELLRKATEDVKAGNTSLKQQVRTVGNKFLNAVEISAQEAAYICLQLPMKQSSRKVVFVNTSPPSERVTLLKSQEALQQMDDDDDDIECSNDISRYSERPTSMENITLAEFVSFYERKRTSVKNKQTVSATDQNFLKETYDNEDELQDDEEMEQFEQNPNDQTQYRRRKHGNILRPVHFNPDSDSEKYYRELIMLYYPWRNEQCLKKDTETYAERYANIKEQVDECRQKFEPYAEAVDMAQEIIKQTLEQDDAWDQLAPENQQADEEDRQNMPTPQDTGIEDPDIAQDLGISVCRVEDDLHAYNEMNDEEYRAHMRNLTPKQIEFVNDTIHLIKTSTEPIYRFLTGGAGVGKSFVTTALYQTALKFLNTRCGQDFTSRKVLVLAPTGKAAYHVKGTTIHSGLKIPANQRLEHKPLPCGTLSTLRNEISNVKVIFIDEISMVGFKMFNCINQRLMEVMQSPKPFGGISIIAVGDLFQLKPVMDSYIFKQPTSGYLPLASNPWTDLFTIVELTEILRQADNKPFAELLNRLREGNQTDDDISTLKTRLIDQSSPNYPQEAPHLFATNDSVNSFNDTHILRTNKPLITVTAKDTVVGSTPPTMKEKIINNFKTSTQTKQLPNVLKLCEGVWYDLTVNLDTADGLINGASCIIKKIDIPSGRSIPNGKLWVQFLDKAAGAALRNTKRFHKRGIDKDWTPIEPVVKQFPAGHKGQAMIQRLQFPIRPAHAKTIHRSQGDTLATAVIDLTTTRKIDHLHYVAISRVTSLDGLHMINLQDNKISVSEEVKKEMNRLRSKHVQIQQTNLNALPSSFNIIYLNSRSLHRHLQDVQNDNNIKAADVACFSETRFCDTDTLDDTSLHNYHQYRLDENQTANPRPFHGMAIYSPTPFEKTIDLSANNIELALFQVPVKDIMFLSVYKYPAAKIKTLCKIIQDVHDAYLRNNRCIILGDFNIDWNSISTEKTLLENLLVKGLGYKQEIHVPTTNYGSTLDLVFHNLEGNVLSGTREAYYSDHKIIWMAL